MDWKNKYLKYKNKYLNLKTLSGGSLDRFIQAASLFFNKNTNNMNGEIVDKYKNFYLEDLIRQCRLDISSNKIRFSETELGKHSNNENCKKLYDKLYSLLSDIDIFFNETKYLNKMAEFNDLYNSSENCYGNEINTFLQNFRETVMYLFFKYSTASNKRMLDSYQLIFTNIHSFYIKLSMTIYNIDKLDTLNIHSYATGNGVFEALFTIYIKIYYQNIRNINIIYYENLLYSGDILSSYGLFDNVVNGYQNNIDRYPPNIFISISPQGFDSDNLQLMRIATQINSILSKIPIIIILPEGWNIQGETELIKQKLKQNIIRVDARNNRNFITYIDNHDFIKYLEGGSIFIDKISYE